MHLVEVHARIRRTEAKGPFRTEEMDLVPAGGQCEAQFGGYDAAAAD